MATTSAESQPPFNEMDLHLDITQHPYEIRILKDKKTATYIGKANHELDVGCVRSIKPVPKSITSVFYYEVTIINQGLQASNSQVEVGFAPNGFQLNQHLGTTADSIGYYARDGAVYYGMSDKVKFGPSYGLTDVIGCGIRWDTERIFFTKNGEFLGYLQDSIASTCIEKWFRRNIPVYATIALHGRGESIKVNFGRDSEPNFLFNIASIKEAQRISNDEQLHNIIIPKQDISCIIREYLYYHGYSQTLNVFSIVHSSPHEAAGKGDNTLQLRSQVRKHIMDGSKKALGELLTSLSSSNPQLLQHDAELRFRIDILQFIATLQESGKEAAVNYAKEELKKYYHDNLKSDEIRQVLSLLVYLPEDQELLPKTEHYLSREHRDEVADKVNIALDTIDIPALQQLYDHFSALTSSKYFMCN